jgi:hypothetical protein
MASPDYFQLMRIPLLHGRTFMAGDVRATMPGMVLSASLARALFGRTDVIGRAVRPPSPGPDVFFTIVGVVGDVPRWRIEEGPVSMAYFPLLRDADGLHTDSVRIPLVMGSARYVVRSDFTLAELAGPMRSAVRELDARVPVTNLTSLEDMVDAASARTRLTMLLLLCAASAALVLGVVGIYSMVSYAVAGRQREFGVRLALGATPSRIQSMVLYEGTALTVIGVAIGLLASLWAGRVMQSLLYGVRPNDPLIFASVAALLLGVAVLATMVPARRASHVDPVEVMRGE